MQGGRGKEGGGFKPATESEEYPVSAWSDCGHAGEIVSCVLAAYAAAAAHIEGVYCRVCITCQTNIFEKP